MNRPGRGPAAPKASSLNSGRILHRPRQHNADDPVACFVTALHRRVRDYGAEPWPLGPAEYDALMRREVESWAPVVRASGAMVE